MSRFEQLARLADEVEAKASASPEASYTAKLLRQGVETCAKKFGEEAVELALASVSLKREDVIREAADVHYHLLVLLQASGITPEDVMAELKRRAGVSGLAEKAARKND
jgi:phosphoribosyl-ATP pyrophosphohydrolase